MNYYIIEGKLYAVAIEDLWEGEFSNKHLASLRNLLRFSTFAITDNDEDYIRYELIKNRFDGSKLKFISIYDAVEYSRCVWPGIQRHMGMTHLKSNGEVQKLIHNLFPMTDLKRNEGIKKLISDYFKDEESDNDS